MAAGGAIVVFYKQIADGAFSGVNSYNKVKLGGLITIGVGFLFFTNLHSSILYFIMHMIAPDVFK